jgi:hypothetical protein
MLFDLEDYAQSGFFGLANGHLSNGGFDGIAIPPVPGKQHSPFHWEDAEIAWNATRLAYMNATKEYILSSLFFSTVSEKPAILAAELDIYTKFRTLMPISRNFWNALKTLPAKDAGFNEGDIIAFMNKENANNYGLSGYDFEAIQNRDMVLRPFTAYLVNDSIPQQVQDWGGHTYTEMTQELYDSYSAAFKDWMGAYKGLYLAVDGATFEEYVAPLVPVWNSYPELSGYVRGTNNLTIKDAVVRLVDVAGVNHDIVTDANGYYKFDKEMFYNTITFDHGATASNFNMFVLENTAPTDYSFFFKDNSLYDKTSIFQNSFFGAENNRDFTWPVQVKMGKSLRRNFKLEVRGDYSNYPSFSGYVKDAAGNPIENAFVAIKDPGTGWSIGEYKKPSGYYGMKFTYDDFGTSRSVLTDANGYYEYTSQMVGEWFTKELINDNYIPSGSMMTAHTFNDYFVNTFVTTTDYYSGKILRSNDFVVCLVPYVQDVNNDSISWDGVSIYDRNEYSTSRFKYALNNYNEFFYQEINLDTHYDIDVNISLAVGDEVRADKVFFKLDDRCKEVNNAFPIQLQVGFDNEWAKTPDQRIKIVYPKTGQSYMFGRNEDYRYDSSWHLNVNSTNFDDYSEFYFYACDSSGRALGFINLINTQSTNSVIESIDLSGLSCLNRLLIGERFYGDSIDLTGMESLYNFESQSGFIKNIEGMENSINNLFLYNALIETLDISGLTNLDDLRLSNLPLLQSLDLQHNTNLSRINIKNVDVNIDVTGLGRLWSVNYDKITMTSDDIDDLLIQMANNPSPYTDPNDTWSYGRFVEGGSIKFYDEEHGSPRIARSSYSDSAFDILANNRHWSIGLGSGFYPDLIEPKKLVLTVDPNLVDTYSEYLSTNFNVQTSTGYWIGKLWNGRIVGYLPMINLNGSSINETFRLGTENTTIEIYSCDEYGIPQGDITSFELSSGFVFSDIDTSELTGLTNLSFYGSGSIESLDLKSNINLDHLVVTGCSSIDSIDVTGLTSLKHINIGNSSLSEVIGFSTLSSLESIDIDGLPNLSYLSFAGLNNIRSIYINEDDLYDSTHVDTMLSELNANSVAGVALLDAQIVVKQAEFDAKKTEYDLAEVELQRLFSISQSLGEQHHILDTEMNQLINDGADQSLIDAKQAEIEAKQVEENDAFSARIEFQDTVYIVVNEEYGNLSNELANHQQTRQNYFSGRQVNTYYMARTSASDADYDALIAFGWTLSLGGEFISPYSQPVKGFMTIDWDSNDNSSDNYHFGNLLRLKSTTGYLKVKSGRYSEKLSVNSDATSAIDSIYFYAQKGIMEFYSCDSHGRPAGNIIGFGKTGNESSFIKSFDISNLTDIINLYFETGFQSISTIDLSSNINIKSLTITNWNSLESIVGFENLVNLKDIYMGSNTSLDIPVDFSSMVNLQRIYLYDINGINKNSRLNVSGLTRLQYIYLSWTNILSVDLDNALLALDAAGLNSESDFNYEGHLPFLNTGLDFSIGMGIGYHAESASAFTSLQSKGWSLSVGDQIIDSVEEPTKGIVRWANDSTWAAIQFGLESGISVMAKYPNGIQNVGSMISFGFDSNVPVEDRFIEFWAVDSYGRPRHDGITQINEYWNTRITSLELDNIKSAITTISVPSGHAIQSMDLSGFSNLTYFELSNSSTLESVIFTGCSKIRNITFQESPNLNIDAVLESIDSTGSEADFNNWGSNYLYAQKSIATSVSEAFLDSLVDKGWEIYLIEAPSVPMILNVVSGDLIDFNVSSSTGTIKLIFPEGSSMHQQWSDGWTQGSSPFRSINNFGYSNYQFSADFTGQISIISVAQNQNDGSFFNSGKIRYIRNIGQGTFDVNTMGNLKIISMDNPTSVAIAAIANFNLSLLEIDSYSGNSLDLSNHLSKGIRITQTAATDLASILFNNSVLNTLNLHNCTSIDSIDLTGAIMTGVWLSNCQSLTNIELPAVISSLNINNCPLLTGALDLTGCAGLNDLYLNMTSIYSIDITGLSNIFSISLDNTNCDIIGFETTSTKQFTHSNVDKNNYVLAVPTTLEGLNIGSISIQSLILTQSGIFKTNTQLAIDDSNTQHGNDPISSMVLPIDKYSYIYLQGLSVLPDLSIMDPRTNLGLYNISVTSIDLQGLSANEVTISGGAFQSINISGNITSGLRLQSTSYTSMDFSNLTSDYIMTQSMSLQGPILTRTNQNFTISGGNNINLTGSTLGNVDIQATGVINLSGITANTVKLRYCYNVTSMNFNGSTINNLEMRYTNYENNMPTFQISMVSLVIINTLLIMSNKATSIDATDAAIPYGYIEQNQYLTNFTYSLKGSRVLAMTLNTPLITISLTDSNLNTLLERVEILGSVTLSANVVNSVINSISTSDLTGKTLILRNMNSRTSVSQTGYTKLVNQSWNMITS